MAVKPGWEGRYFEDFEVGDVYRCRLGRTITEADNISFTLLTNNTNQIHFNNEYGKQTEFGKCLVNSALTLAIVAGLGVADVSENGFASAGMRSSYQTRFSPVIRFTRNPRSWTSASQNRSLNGESSRSAPAASSKTAR